MFVLKLSSIQNTLKSHISIDSKFNIWNKYFIKIQFLLKVWFNKINSFLKILAIILEWKLIYVFIFEAILSHLIDLGFSQGSSTLSDLAI